MLVKELLEQFRGSVCRPAEPHRRESGRGIVVCARKRPVSERENDAARVRTGGVLECALDAVTCRNPRVYVHEARKRVDDTQAVETTEFTFDHTFGEESDTGAVYAAVVRPLVEAAVVRGGVSTVFAYGQTGSGKTYTMTGVEAYAAADIYAFAGALEQEHRRLHYGPAAGGLEVRVAFFEIAGDRVYDLLHGRTELFVREDDAGDVHVCGLQAERAGTPEELLALIHAGSEQRCTKATFKNESSSRTHAVCQITLHALGGPEAAGTPAGTPLGKLSLVDLAGSERAGDVVHHTQERQRETIAINSSLMTLQECIRCRALEARNAATYVPFRQSKLTMLLRDSFTRDEVATAVIVTVSPLQADTQHTLSTCRFAARIKDKGPTPSSGIDKADPRTWSKQDVAAWLDALFTARLPLQTARIARAACPSSTGKYLAVLSLEECSKLFGIDSVGRLVYTELQKLLQEAKARASGGGGGGGGYGSATTGGGSSGSGNGSGSAKGRRKSITPTTVMDASSLLHPLPNRRTTIAASPAKRLSFAPGSSTTGASDSMTPHKKKRLSVGGTALFRPAAAAASSSSVKKHIATTTITAAATTTTTTTPFATLLNEADTETGRGTDGLFLGSTPAQQRLAGTIPTSTESPPLTMDSINSGLDRYYYYQQQQQQQQQLQQQQSGGQRATKFYGDSPSSSFTLPGKDERSKISKLFPGIKRDKGPSESTLTSSSSSSSSSTSSISGSAVPKPQRLSSSFTDDYYNNTSQDYALSSTTLSLYGGPGTQRTPSAPSQASKIPRPAAGAQEASARLSSIIENANGEKPPYPRLTPQQQMFVEQQQLQRERDAAAAAAAAASALRQQDELLQLQQQQQQQQQQEALLRRRQQEEELRQRQQREQEELLSRQQRELALKKQQKQQQQQQQESEQRETRKAQKQQQQIDEFEVIYKVNTNKHKHT